MPEGPEIRRAADKLAAWAAVQAETVCLHGDGEHALAYARKLRDSFVQQGIRVSAEQ